MALEFLPYGTRVSHLWNWSFTPMELEFHTYGTRVSPLWNWLTALFKRAKQGGDT